MSDPTEVEHCEYSSDSWVSLAEILSHPKNSVKPRVTIALLTTIIETEGIKTIDRARRIIKATSGGKSEFASEASVIDFLATYCEELDASNALPRGQHPTHDPDRWLEYESPLCKFGWPKDEVPDFAEWIAKNPDTPSFQKEGAVKGMAKQQVIDAFEGLHFTTGAQWSKALADVPKWLEPCRVMKGSKKASALWNPAQIAVALYDKKIPIKKLDAVFVGLNAWTDEWQKTSELLR